MLQQTRVDTVLRYYDRFMDRFPSIEALARANEDEVLAMWSGLGYYRRARLLYSGVREVVARYGARVPEDQEARLSLPGVGRYTAGAIGSIAFDREEPLVDGNVARVLCRVRGIETPLGRAETENRLWKEAEALVRGPRPGALNQALMELGATVCTPSAPRCGECPLAGPCVARQTDRALSLPLAKRRRAPLPVNMVAVVAAIGDDVLMVRGEDALFGGLWGVPMREGASVAAARAALRELEVKARVSSRPSFEVEHVLSHRRLTVRVFSARVDLSVDERVRRVARAELSSLGISTLMRKVLRLSELTDLRKRRPPIAP